METLFVWAAIAGLVWAAVYTQVRWRDFVRLARRIQARVGPLAVTRVLLVLALLVAVNYLAARRNTTWDVTGNRRSSTVPSSGPAAQPSAYFTTGHGERDPGSTDRLGYSAIASLLQPRVTIGKLDLSGSAAVPADAALIVVAGPKIDFLEHEIDALRQYLAGGGSVLFLIDPAAELKRYITESGTSLFMIDPQKQMDAPEMNRLVALIGEWGVQLGNDVVVDVSGMGAFLGTDASVPVAARYPAHPITARLSVLTAFPVARSVTPIDDVHGGSVTVGALIETSPQSWAATDINQLTGGGAVSMDQARGNRHGPLALGAAVSARTRDGEARLVVIGDSDFVANYVGNIPGNVDLFLEAVRWLARQDVADPRGPPGASGTEQRLALTTTQRQIVLWVCRGVLPGAFIAAGLYVWLRRRRA